MCKLCQTKKVIVEHTGIGAVFIHVRTADPALT